MPGKGLAECPIDGEIRNPATSRCVNPKSKAHIALKEKAAKDPAAFAKMLRTKYNYSKKAADKLAEQWSGGKVVVEEKEKHHHHHEHEEKRKKKVVAAAAAAPAPAKKLSPAKAASLSKKKKKKEEENPFRAVGPLSHSKNIPKFSVGKTLSKDAPKFSLKRSLSNPKTPSSKERRVSTSRSKSKGIPYALKLTACETEREELRELAEKYKQEADVLRENMHAQHAKGMVDEAEDKSWKRAREAVAAFKYAEPEVLSASQHVIGSNKFTFYFGAGTSHDAGIPTFRGLGRGVDELVQVAQNAWRKYYFNDPRFGGSSDYARPVKGDLAQALLTDDSDPSQYECLALTQYQYVLSKAVLLTMPKVLEEVWAYMATKMAKKSPTTMHLLAADLLRQGIVQDLITVNIDGLEFAAGCDPEKTWPIHGNIFTWQNPEGFLYQPNPTTRGNKGRLAVALFRSRYEMGVDEGLVSKDELEGDAFLPTDKEDDIVARTEGSILVLDGTTAKVTPEFIEQLEPRRVIIINPSNSAVADIKRLKWKESVSTKFEVFTTPDAFIKTYFPNWQPTPTGLTNTSPQAFDAAIHSIEHMASS